MPRKAKGKRPDGRIQIQIDIGHDENGKRVRKSFFGKTRAEAEHKRDEYLSMTRGITRRADITLSEWIDSYLTAYPSKANPIYHQQNIVPYNRLKTALGTRLITAIREIDLQTFLNTLSGYSASTISKQLQIIKAVFAKARKNRLITDDPAEDLRPPQGSKGTHRALSQSEILLILKYAPQVYSGLWVMLMLFAGLRRSEMIALDWADVDLTARTLTVRRVAVLHNNQPVIQARAKSAAGLRQIPISAPLYDALSAVAAARRSGFVCLSAKGQPLTETAVKNGIQRFIAVVNRAEANLPLNQSGARTDLHPAPPPAFSFRCHDLRHSFCTLLYDGGTDVQTAAYLMGHSDVMVTMRIYTHLSEERRASSYASLLSFLNAYKAP